MKDHQHRVTQYAPHKKLWVLEVLRGPGGGRRGTGVLRGHVQAGRSGRYGGLGGRLCEAPEVREDLFL